DDSAETFSAEAAGLAILREAGSPLLVPVVLFVRGGRPGILLTEWIESGSKGKDFWEDFGRGLARLHRYTGPGYGLDRDNFIGRLPQSNARHESWVEFFVQERIEPQVRRAKEGGRWNSSWNAGLEKLTTCLTALLPDCPEASLIHGDLWGGNFLVAKNGAAALIDPAVYFGHRETDLAMTELFGGFDRRFYAAYREEWPLEPGYEERREVYNLYHLLNHLNHFGGGYAGAVERALRAD
ncbi:MAG: fructosamine kinase family protein, partial [Rhodothermales bacterium]